MKTIEYKTVDKSEWGPGPWQDEPDKVQWLDKATGLPCLARRNTRFGNWCGYVGVPASHPLFEKCEETDNLAVHGGVTFTGKCQNGDESETICHLVDEGEDDNIWWLGFDCGHAFDLSPGMRAFERSKGWPDMLVDREAAYRDLAYVKSECADLARQLVGFTKA